MQAATSTVLLLVIGVTVATAGEQPTVTDADKLAFLEILPKLPNDGEFLTDKGVAKAAPHIAVLFALTEGDIADYDIYPFLAVSRGLADRKKTRDYAVHHFEDIAHPTIKCFWAAVLFKDYTASPEILDYLLWAIDSEGESARLAEMIGPGFEQFKAEVLSATR